MLPAFITHPDCGLHEMGKDHPECPERLGAINDLMLMKGLLNCMQTYAAPLASIEQITRVHTISYVDKLRALVPRSGYVRVDPDTEMNPHTFQAALRAAGAAVLATDLVINRRASTAFCNTRPPGHHAKRAAAGGFCFFNNVAIGIRHALEEHGLQRVVLFDFDAHHGDGSEDIFFDDERVLMCSTFEKGLYPFCGEVPLGPNMHNVGLEPRSGGAAFRATVEDILLPVIEQFKPQMIFISAGFDGHREDDMGNIGLVESDYEWVTRKLVQTAKRHAKGRIISCLEGGYILSPMARSAVSHVRALIEME